MAVTLVNPEALPKVDLYRQVSVTTGTRTVYIAGQVARTAEGDRIGEGDLAAQVEQCYLNVAAALAEVGGTFADVARLTVYFVGWAPEKMGQFVEGVQRAEKRLGVSVQAPLTGIGVAFLAEPDLMVEVEATAVLD
ncbi:RidA family protein [Amycolatopsis jejuensis]|uniref:RidA family protein n=1 Tax=Amycolatopsis jejuensis TaxID=330084 RepID=UPI000527AF41|nr:RidA family protein [Amycolatopsis jejuensis]